jgi:hypoxanthine phosphoribosyltransferase
VDNPRGFPRNEVLTWEDVDKLVDTLVPQLQTVGPFEAMVMITRGGVIPGGIIAEILNIQHMLTAAVDFPSTTKGLETWPSFLQFPDPLLLQGRQTLIIDDVWGSGRTSTAVRGRVQAAGAIPYTCVFHYNPYRSLFSKASPDFYGAVTDAYVVYPWERDRGMRSIPLGNPEVN